MLIGEAEEWGDEVGSTIILSPKRLAMDGLESSISEDAFRFKGFLDAWTET